ncbi:MAG: hypothetical protein HOG49_41595 [Candidatus Scalindua sp.]|jgi:hypothetical protein|nr:hypothetical protein [Candidatus Scalindua sp.]
MNKDDLIYKDDEYQIYKKDSWVVGTMLDSLDIVTIGIAGIPEARSFFKHKKDFNGIIDDFIQELKDLKLK